MAGLLGNHLGCPPPSAHRWPSSRSSFWTEKRGPRTCWRRSPSLTGHIRSSPRRRWPQAPLLPTARPGLCPWAAHLERGLGPWRKLEGRGLAARLEATPLELCHQAGGGWSIPRLTRARKAKAPGQGEGLVPRVDREGGVRRRTGRQTRPQAFLFIFYGLVLQAEESGTTVRTHLRSLLETSHQWPKQREVRPRPRPSPTRLPRPRRSLSLVPPRARTLLTRES